MDWNWFFSSLSQSAAAIVGIFGAFVITKILSNQAVYQQKCYRLDELIIETLKIKDKINAVTFKWLNANCSREALIDFENDLRDFDFGAFNGYFDFNAAYIKYSFSIYSPRALEMIKLKEVFERCRSNYLQKFEQDKLFNENWHAFNKFSNSFGLSVDSDDEIDVPRIPRPAFISGSKEILRMTQEENTLVDSHIRDAKHHARVITSFTSSIHGNPESSSIIAKALILITALFYIGVIYPLSFLPQPLNANITLSLSELIPAIFSVKGLFLISVSVIFTIAIVMFYRMNKEMKYSDSKVSGLVRYKDINEYSRYFVIAKFNLEWLKKADVKK